MQPSQRFRGFLPVVVDVETAGLNPKTDALLEFAAVFLTVNQKKWEPVKTLTRYIVPFAGARLDETSLQFTGIDPEHPFRKKLAIPEKQAMAELFSEVSVALKATRCIRAVLVGHNAAFDLAVLNAATERANFKETPFHPFSTLDTVSLSALVYGQTVLSRAARAADLIWDEREAHSAKYDAEKTAALFCRIVNRWQELSEK